VNHINSRCVKGVFAFGFLLSILLFGSQCTDTFSQGKDIYINRCSNCHGREGQGLAGLYPPLDSSVVIRDSLFLIPCIIKNGLQGPRIVNGQHFNRKMDKITGLNDVEISNLINYLHAAFGKSAHSIYPKTIDKWIDDCK
jgi:mono/diheme cytochrome c family protein